MTPQEFIDTVTADLKRIDSERRFAAHMIDAAETFQRNNEPDSLKRAEAALAWATKIDRSQQQRMSINELRRAFGFGPLGDNPATS